MSPGHGEFGVKSNRFVGIGLGLLVVLAAGSFVVTPGGARPPPVDFDDTVKVGLSLEERQSIGERVIPRVQVSYSQYPYVVGYRGLGQAAEAVDDPLIHQQFGYPRVVYVEVAPADVEVDDAGLLVGDQTNTWLPAEDVTYVVGSNATIADTTVTVPFEREADASAFADAYGGRVVEWSDRARFEAPAGNGTTARSRIDAHHDRADATVAERHRLLERETSVVVGADEPTVEAAIEAAPPNTTVLLPPGTYEGPLVVDKSVTLRGDDATIVGTDNGSVLTVRASDVAVSGLSITGVGGEQEKENVSVEGWDSHTVEAYGYADSGIVVDDADRVLVFRTDIETRTAGITVRNSEGTVVDTVSVSGAETWEDGFMGVTTIRSPIVLQNSTFVDGRDGVYMHRSRGITVRENRFVGGRYGGHFMYTSDGLFADNCATGQQYAGVVVMTSPTGVAISGNTVIESGQGIVPSGSDSYVGENTVVGTRQGISTNARNSLYTRNTVVGNDVGFRSASIIPTSRVVENDIVDNHRPVNVGTGPLRIWSHDGAGNYWGAEVDTDREFVPSDSVDGRLHRDPAARTLAASPVVRGIRELRTTAPGMRPATVVDAHPRSTPVNETRLERGRALANGTAPTDELGCPA